MPNITEEELIIERKPMLERNYKPRVTVVEMFGSTGEYTIGQNVITLLKQYKI